MLVVKGIAGSDGWLNLRIMSTVSQRAEPSVWLVTKGYHVLHTRDTLSTQLTLAISG